jgi:hypothetical protein
VLVPDLAPGSSSPSPARPTSLTFQRFRLQLTVHSLTSHYLTNLPKPHLHYISPFLLLHLLLLLLFLVPNSSSFISYSKPPKLNTSQHNTRSSHPPLAAAIVVDLAVIAPLILPQALLRYKQHFPYSNPHSQNAFLCNHLSIDFSGIPRDNANLHQERLGRQ